jgi:hypothetical protein
MQDEHEGATGSFVPTWRKALRDETAFAQLVRPQVRLEGSIFAAPVNGREKVWTAIRTAGDITDTLRFTRESTVADRCYLEWELDALGGRINGVSVISFDSSGLIDSMAFYHRPLAGLLAFSAEMGRRLGSSIGHEMFYPAPAGSRS